MAIWAIADIHASRIDRETGKPSKPMDLFGSHWQDHVDRIADAWQSSVAPEDTVLVAGDIDWAMRPEDAIDTLSRIGSWNGRKILLRGNHDYWWSSKATSKIRKILPPSVEALHNNAFQVESFNICGAKGSPVPGGIDWTAENAKLLNREHQRLVMSLEARDPGLPTIVALHFPPFYPSHRTSPYGEELDRYTVSACVYGHLHGEAAAAGPIGCYGATEYILVAADAVGFRPVLIAREGIIIATPQDQPDQIVGQSRIL